MRKKATKAEMPQALTDEALKEAPENGKRQKLMEKGEKPLLRNRSYLLLLQGNLFSGFGDVLFSIAAGIWVYKQTGSTMMMSVMSSISMAVSVLITPFLGPIVDRRSKKRMMVLMDFIRGVTLVLAGLWFWGRPLSVPVLILCAAAMALCNALFNPAATAAFSLVVSRSQFMKAQSWNTGLFMVINLTGKGICSLLALMCGPATLLIVNGVLYWASSLSECFITLRPTEVPASASSSFFNDFKEGLQITFGNPSLRDLLLLLLAWNVLVSGLSSVTLPFLQQKGLADEFYSLYLTFGSVGAVAGTFIPGMLPKPLRDKLCSLLPMILGTLASFITALSRNPALVCISYLIANLLNSIGNIIVSSAMILGCEEQMRGRLVALETSIMTAGRLISTLAFGFFGESLALGLLSAIGQGICLILYLPFVRNRRLNQFMKEGVSTESGAS